MGQKEQLLAKSPKLWIGLAKETTQDVQPLFVLAERTSNSFCFWSQGTGRLKLLENEITYYKTYEKGMVKKNILVNHYIISTTCNGYNGKQNNCCNYI